MKIKKMLAMALALMLLAGLAGCGASKEEPPTDIEDAMSDEFAALMEGRKPVGELTDKEKRALIDEGRDLGLNVAFDNGSLVVTDDKGDLILRRDADGAVWDDFGNQIVANEWPDNEFTRQVPNPGVKNAAVKSNSGGITAMIDDMDEAAAKAYVEQLKGRGFTTELPGMELAHGIEYNAKNGAGYTVEFFWANGGANLVVTK